MKSTQVTETYNAGYAAAYDQTFLHAAWARPSLDFQLDLLREHLTGAQNWLDVACGTGFVLSQFPEIERTGLDLSADMLAVARERNPGVEFVQRDFRQPWPAWNDRFAVVTCMWWAYCLAETMQEIKALVARLAEWTTPDGTCILPLCNVNKFDLHNIRLPYIDSNVRGRCMITGITWAWRQENGERHDDVLSPQVEHMVLMFRQHFDEVEIVSGDLAVVGEGWQVQDVLVARRKRGTPPPGDFYPPGDGERAGQLEWHLGTNGEARARLTYPDIQDLRRVRVAVDRADGGEPWRVQVNKAGYLLRGGGRYRLEFRARADAPRTVYVGVSHGESPWSSLGHYAEYAITPDWSAHEAEFVATEDGIRSRVHFDLATSLIPVELANVRLHEIAPPAAD